MSKYISFGAIARPQTLVVFLLVLFASCWLLVSPAKAQTYEGCDDEVCYIDDPPSLDTTIDSGTVENNYATFKFSGTGGSGTLSYQCRFDEQPWKSCSSPKSYSKVAGGTHTFEVRARDNAGNVDPTPALHNFLVGSEVPNSEIETLLQNKSQETSGDPQFTRSAFPYEIPCTGNIFKPFKGPAPNDNQWNAEYYIYGSFNMYCAAEAQVTTVNWLYRKVPGGKWKVIAKKQRLGFTQNGWVYSSAWTGLKCVRGAQYYTYVQTQVIVPGAEVGTAADASPIVRLC